MTTIGTFLIELDQLGVFYYALPFLLVFALVFAVLQKIKITGREDRGINAVIALAVGLLSLVGNRVPDFFQVLLPNVGVGLGVILLCLIMVGLFVNPQEHTFAVWTFFGIGGITAIIILLSSFNDYWWWRGDFWNRNMTAIIAGIVILVFVIVVINSGKQSSGDPFKKVVQ